MPDTDSMVLDAAPVEPIQDAESETQSFASLEMMPNELDDATHDRLNAKVLKYAPISRLPASSDPAAPFLAAALLETIVSTSEGSLGAPYQSSVKAMTVLHEHPSLFPMLQSALEAGSFNEIRNLSAISAFK